MGNSRARRLCECKALYGEGTVVFLIYWDCEALCSNGTVVLLGILTIIAIVLHSGGPDSIAKQLADIKQFLPIVSADHSIELNIDCFHWIVSSDV